MSKKKRITGAIVMSIISMGLLSACGNSADTELNKEDEIVSTTETTEEGTTEAVTEDTGADQEQNQSLANPWTVSDYDGVLSATGFPVNVPDGATDVVYSYMAEEKLAEATYKYDGVDWVYRMQETDSLTDISGMNYEWTFQQDGEVANCPAKFMGYTDQAEGADTLDGVTGVQVASWYHRVTGITYSLSASGDINGMDIQVYAENIFLPLQGEADGDAVTEDVALEENVPEQAGTEDSFAGIYIRSYDDSDLFIEDNKDGTYLVNLGIFRLCALDDGVGVIENNIDSQQLAVTVKDPNGEDMKYIISKAEDQTLTVTFTESNWDLIPNGETLDGFAK